MIVTFHEIAKSYESELKTQVRFIRYFYKPYRGITEVPSLEILSNDLSIYDVYHVMKDFHLCGWLLSCDLSKILVKLVISLKHNIIFENFVKYYWTITYLVRIHTFADKAKIVMKLFEFTFSDILLKALSHQDVFKNALEKFNAPRF